MGPIRMDHPVRTTPTSTLTVREFAQATFPEAMKGLTEADVAVALDEADRRGMDLARRLGVDRADRRLPFYIWAIVCGEKTM